MGCCQETFTQRPSKWCSLSTQRQRPFQAYGAPYEEACPLSPVVLIPFPPTSVMQNPETRLEAEAHFSLFYSSIHLSEPQGQVLSCLLTIFHIVFLHEGGLDCCLWCSKWGFRFPSGGSRPQTWVPQVLPVWAKVGHHQAGVKQTLVMLFDCPQFLSGQSMVFRVHPWWCWITTEHN